MATKKLQTLTVDLQLVSNSYDAKIEKHRSKTRAFAKQAHAANDASFGLGEGFRSLANQAAVLDGPMGGLSGRLSAVASGISSIGVVGFAATAGLAAVTAGAYQSLKVFSQWEQQQFRTVALLRSTGNASGLTAEQINELSRTVALNTLGSVEGVNDATSVLLTFKTVQEDVFVKAIELSQDMAAVMGGDAKSAALQLGKALEDPATGLNALKRSGVSFSESEKQVIKGLQETNRLADAQRLILEKLQAQVGGAGSAEAQGLSGAFDTLGQRYDEFLYDLGETSALGAGATSAVNGLAGAIAQLNRDLFPDNEQRLGELVHERQRILEDIQEMNAQGGREALPLMNPFGFSKNDWMNAQREYAQLTKEIADLTEEFNAKRDAEDKAREAAERARNEAATEAEKQRLKLIEEARQKAAAEQLKRDAAELARKQQAGVALLSQMDMQFASEDGKLRLAYEARLQQIQQMQLKEQDVARAGYESLAALRSDYEAQALFQYELDKEALALKREEERQAEVDKRLAEIEQLRLAQRTQAQVEAEAYAARKLMLDNARRDGLLAEADYHRISVKNWRDYHAKLTAAEQEKSSAIRQSSAQLFGDLGTLAAGFGGEQTALYRAMFAVSKGFAIADSIVKIQQGIASAAVLPFPANIPAIASVVSTTAGVLSTIKSTQLQYHTGGIAGQAADNYGASLRKDEVQAVLKRGEEVITVTDPRHRDNLTTQAAGSASAGSVVVNNYVNVYDRAGTDISVQNRDDGGVDIYIDQIDQGLASRAQRGNSAFADVISEVHGIKRVARR